MSDATTHLLLPYILAAQAQKHVTHNEALRILDGLVQLSVLDRDLTAPPGSPADGDRYIVASGATGDWAGWDLNVALWTDGAWLRLASSLSTLRSTDRKSRRNCCSFSNRESAALVMSCRCIYMALP